MRRGQSTLDYIFLIGIAAAGLVAMLAYVGRGLQGNLRKNAEQLGAWQYEPGNTTINNSEIKTATSTANSGSSTTISYGNMNEPNTKLEEKLKDIKKQQDIIVELKKNWELKAVSEAKAGAKAVRGGNFDWQPPAGGLAQISKDLKDAIDDLNILLAEAKELDDAWKARVITPDVTGPTTTYSNEEGDTTDDKHTDEALGKFRK